MDDDFNIQIVAEVQGMCGYGTLHVMNDGYLYVSHHLTQSAKYFRCKEYRAGCPGRVTFYANGLNIATNAHNHDPDGVTELVHRATRHSLLQQAMTSRTATLGDLFDDPRNANHLYTLQQLLPSMMRLRERNLPQCHSFRQLTEILRNPDLAFLTRIHQFEDTLYQGFAESTDQSHVLLFMSRKGSDFLQMTPSVSVLHIPLPPSHQQYEMCVVAGVWERSVMPLAWIVLEKYTYEALHTVFQLLKSKLTVSSFFHVISRADVAGYAFSHVFSVELNPSLYDFIYDIVSSEDTGFTKESLKDNLALGHIVGLCCALPLLPADRIQTGIDVIINETYLCGEAIYNQAVPLFHYIEEKWLKIPDKKFSMCGNVNRTNYGCEDLRSKVTAAVTRSNPGFYSLIRNIVSMSIKSDADISLALSGGRNNSRQGQVPLLAQSDIVNLLRVVIRPPFNIQSAVRDFLVAVSGKIIHLL